MLLRLRLPYLLKVGELEGPVVSCAALNRIGIEQTRGSEGRHSRCGDRVVFGFEREKEAMKAGGGGGTAKHLVVISERRR